MDESSYQLLERIGAGAHGETFRARDVSGRTVAIKRLRVAGLPDWKPLERFEREAKVLRSLHHPRIVRFIDAFQAEEGGAPAFFIVSELVEGYTLASRIARGDRWDEAEARHLLESLLEALRYLHGLSPHVIHRDIKPSNIILRPDGEPVLVDFGSVVEATTREADSDVTVAGTAGYMAPEQAMGIADPRSDLYGLGVTMLHMLSHQHPLRLPRDGLELRVPTSVHVSASLRGVIERLIAYAPDRRYGSASEALEALRRGTEPRCASTSEGAASRPSLSGRVASDHTPARHESQLPMAFHAAPRRFTPALAPLIKQRAEAVANAEQKGDGGLALAGALFIGGPLLGGPLTGICGMWGLALGLGLSMLGVAICFNVVRRYGLLVRELRSLFVGGHHVTGRVMSLSTLPGGTITTISYEYSVGGSRYRRTLDTRDGPLIRELGPEDTVSVFHHPDAPGRPVALLDAEVRAAREHDGKWGRRREQPAGQSLRGASNLG